MIASLLAWPGALAIGLSLGLLGSGGSVMTVPVLVYLLGQDEKIAIAGSLFIVGSIALAGSLQVLHGKQIHWKSVLSFGVPGMAGTYLGALLAGFVAGFVQLVLFALVMLVAAYLMLRPPNLQAAPKAPRATWKIAADGLLVGVITGLVGVGGGFLIVPALVLLGGLQMHQAVATSLIIIAMKSFSGFYKYLDVLDTQSLDLDWQALAIVTVVGIIGSFLGARMRNRVPQHKLKAGFGYFLIVMAIVILVESVPKIISTSGGRGNAISQAR